METIKNNPRIRDKRRQMFLTDDEYLNGYAKLCGVYGTAVYMSLCRHANKQQYCFPGIEKMMEQHNCSKNPILKGIELLEKHNIIRVDRSKKGKKTIENNGYTLLDRSEWTLKASSSEDLKQVHQKNLNKFSRRTVRDIDKSISTHNKDSIDKSIELHSPTSQMRKFLKAFWKSKEKTYQKLEKMLDQEFSDSTRNEVNNFVDYWTELNKTGKKQRWELQQTFELKRRLKTWFRRADEFKNNNNGVAVAT